MATALSKMMVELGLDTSDFQRGISRMQRDLKRSLGNDALSASDNLVKGMAGVGVAIGAVGLASIKMAANMEQTKIAFTSMIGEAGMADVMLRRLQDFADSTPFEFEGLTDATRKLMAYGFELNQIIPTLTNIGDAVAAMGGGAAMIERITTAFGQMRAKGFISGEEMRQLAEAGIPAWEMLAKTIGKSIPEAMKLAENKAIDSGKAMQGILDQMGQRFGGMMAQQSQTVLGLWSTIKDKTSNVMRKIGDDIIQAFDLKSKMQGAIVYLSKFADDVQNSGVREAFKSLVGEQVIMGFYAAAGAITAAMLPALSRLALAAWAALVPLGKIALIGAALGIIAYGMQELGDRTSQAFQNLQASAAYMSDIQVGLDNVGTSAKKAAGSMGDFKRTDEAMTKLAEATSKTSVSMTGLGDAGGKAADKIADKVRQLTESIEREWVTTTMTQMQQLELWKAENLASLAELRTANENYERDRERVLATYSARRINIAKQEAEVMRSLQKDIKDPERSFQIDFAGSGLDGMAKQLFDIQIAAQNRMKSVDDYFAGIQSKWVGATEKEKATIIASLDEVGLKYRQTEDGKLDFSNARRQKELQNETMVQNEITKLQQSMGAIRSELDAARQAGDFARFRQFLTDQTAARMADYEGQVAMMDLYQQIMLDKNMSWSTVMASVGKSAYTGLQTALTNIMTGTQSVGEAFAQLGKSILATIAGLVAKWIAAQIFAAAFGEGARNKELLLSAKAAKATALAWSSAAAMVSLATFGANSGPAMLGIGATVGLAAALSSIPGFAEGGIISSPTLGMIGEGRYPEAVLPLSPKVLGALGGGGGGVYVTQHNYGDYNYKTDVEEVNRGLANELKFAMMGA